MTDRPTIIHNFAGTAVGHRCPQCGVEVRSFWDVAQLFGWYRDAKGVPRCQSWCRRCRSTKAKNTEATDG